jgi:hypothetical protein
MYVESPIKKFGDLTLSGKKKKKKKSYRKNLPTLENAPVDAIPEHRIEETPTGNKTLRIKVQDLEALEAA